MGDDFHTKQGFNNAFIQFTILFRFAYKQEKRNVYLRAYLVADVAGIANNPINSTCIPVEQPPAAV